MTSFSAELGVRFDIHLEASHVIDPKQQLWIGTMAVSPTGALLNGVYKVAEVRCVRSRVQLRSCRWSVCVRADAGVPRRRRRLPARHRGNCARGHPVLLSLLPPPGEGGPLIGMWLCLYDRHPLFARRCLSVGSPRACGLSWATSNRSSQRQRATRSHLRSCWRAFGEGSPAGT